MANNFRGTTRQLYNPRNVKYLETPDARKEYQQLRRVALKRAARLEKAGLDYLPEADPDFKPSSKLSDDEIREALVNVSDYLRDPYSLVQPAREIANLPEDKQAYSRKGRTVVLSAIPAMGGISNKDRKRFGRFMDEVRARGSGRGPWSDQQRTAYEEAISRGMRPETLLKHFEKYVADAEKSDLIAEKLFHAPKEGRLTIAKLNALLGNSPKSREKTSRGSGVKAFAKKGRRPLSSRG